MSSENLLIELHSKLTPPQFEQFLSVLLGMMEFSDVRITGRSGDRGIDLEATWTQTNIPGLEIDLPFKIQAKRYSPNSTLNPRYIRELRGTLRAGEWGLLITTSKVTSRTLQESMADSSRVISIIDGAKLIELCKEYKVGVKPEYKVDLSSIGIEELPPPQIAELGTKNIKEMLDESLGENFSRLGKSSIYVSTSKRVIARISQHYDRTDSNFWYGTTQKDVERVKEYRVTHFAYVCSNIGVILIPTQEMLREIQRNNLAFSTTKEGKIRHYHIQFFERDGTMYWNLKGKNKDITEFFWKITAPS